MKDGAGLIALSFMVADVKIACNSEAWGAALVRDFSCSFGGSCCGSRRRDTVLQGCARESNAHTLTSLRESYSDSRSALLRTPDVLPLPLGCTTPLCRLLVLLLVVLRSKVCQPQHQPELFRPSSCESSFDICSSARKRLRRADMLICSSLMTDRACSNA